MTSYNQLVKRLEALGEASSTIGDYTISPTNKNEMSSSRGFFKTPDEALGDIYEDARKHGLEKIYVILSYFYEDNILDFEGYTWKPEITFSHPEKLEEEEKSYLRIVGDSWISRHDPITYPDPKPDLEVFDIYGTRALEWCLSYGYPSIEEYERCEVVELNHYEPGRYSVEDVGDMYQLIQQYRQAGYQVDYPHEPKNPVEVKMDSYSRHKKEEEKA